MFRSVGLGAAVGLALAVGAHAEESTAVRREAAAVKGLAQPAELVVDRWGVPHIYAQSARDAFFLQGWNAARDRLWQIDLWRKRGLGRLSASFGPAYVKQDRAARLFLYRGDMAAEWAAYGPDGREAVEAFAAGINAYVAEVRAGRRPLPVEFGLTESAPEDWAPEDVLRIRSHALVSNVASEVARARTICAGGVEADALRRRLEPARKVQVPAGLDPCDVPEDVLADYLLGTAAVSFEAPRASGAGGRLAQHIEAASAEGSNNWVIGADRTATGRPILANDPHRAVGTPSLRYIAHLDAPGLSIIGAGEPALPGVSLGHNGHAAFGLTIFYIDQEDLYVYETRGDAYRYKGGWEPMRVVRETIEVKGEAPREVELRFTRHGPVLKQDDARGRAFALRTVWNEPGLSGYFGSARLWRAKSWDDFQAARDRWGAPPLNLVYADTSGDIGWSAAGRTPRRPNWDGLTPVPGDGRYEWQGFLQDGGLPAVRNPKAGFFATANEMNVPADYPMAERKLGFEWSDRTRSTRIHEVLAATAKATLADSMALQTDTVSAQVRRAQALIAPLASDDPDVARALALLKAWDGDERLDSPAASIYEVWVGKHLGREVAARNLASEEARRLIGAGSPDAVLLWLENAAPAARAPLLLASLKAATAELRARLGPDMATWTWGRLHHAKFTPAAAALADPALAAQMTVGTLQVPGSASTPRAASWRAIDFQQTAGASVRLVLDVGAWDNSMAINTPGQSGDPFSPHYRDLFPLWAAGAYVPLRFSRAAVMGDAETVMSLTPAP
ncbi:penicillin acylase family protein [Phenylobacterium sp.]|uniref:penicillin acylase family protein n=1 Tax=Phenylobacterium sp. TaxID=1871053 RepID=UPI00394662F2